MDTRRESNRDTTRCYSVKRQIPHYSCPQARRLAAGECACTIPHRIYKGVVMPRKAKAFKSRLRAAAKAAGQGKSEEANKMLQQITVDRNKAKAEKLAKQDAKKAGKK